MIAFSKNSCTSDSKLILKIVAINDAIKKNLFLNSPRKQKILCVYYMILLLINKIKLS